MNYKIILVAVVIFFTGTIYAQTADGVTPAVEVPCDLESGAAFGLCVSYCEAMDCDSEQAFATETACLKIQDRFIQKTGRDLPCIIPPPECPCFTHQEVAEIADTQTSASEFWCFNEATSGSSLAQTIQSTVGIPFDPFEDWEASAFDHNHGDRLVECEYRNMVWDGENATQTQRLWVELPTIGNRALYQACSDIISDVIDAYSLVCTGPN